MPKQNQENYLRTMYSLYENSEDKNLSSVDIAEEMGISKAAVSKMLRKMKEAKLIKMAPYSRITFLSKGFKEAEKVMYKHRIIEVFLVEALKVDKRKVHMEAHALEHAFSDESIKKLAEFLGSPEVCPCGKNIPKMR